MHLFGTILSENDRVKENLPKGRDVKSNIRFLWHQHAGIICTYDSYTIVVGIEKYGGVYSYVTHNI